MKRIKRLSALLAAILLFTLTAPAAAAAEDMISVRTAEDLLELSRKCMLDSWSQGKIVTLEADVDLTGAEFEPIPTFGGTFRGQDHRISGLSLTGSGNVRGVGEYCLNWAFAQCPHLRVDTHADNLPMQRLLGKLGFTQRGIIYVREDHDPRLAYDKF